jgi:hypothetical protein
MNNSLSSATPTAFQPFLSMLAAHHKATNAQMPTFNPTLDPAKVRQTGGAAVD